MTQTTPGKKLQNASTTLSASAGTVSTLIADGLMACEKGLLIIQNPHATAIIFLGLAGETPNTSTPVGFKLAPGASLNIPNPPNNKITAVSDTNSCPVTAYYLGA